MQRTWIWLAASCCLMSCELFDGVLPEPDTSPPETIDMAPEMTDALDMPAPGDMPDVTDLSTTSDMPDQTDMSTLPADWHAPSWRQRMRLSVEIEHVPTTPLDGVVALVRLERSRVDLSAIQPQAQDLRFVTDAGVRVPHEVEAINPTDNTIDVWVKLPPLGPQEPNALWLYYDNPDVSEEPLLESVWSGYEMVHHFSNFDDDGLSQDSSGKGIHAQEQTSTLGYAASGVAGTAPFFLASNQDHILIGRHESLHVTPNSQVVLELWFMTPNVLTQTSTLFTDEALCRGIGMTMGADEMGNGTLVGRLFSTPGPRSCEPGETQNTFIFHRKVPTMEWQHVALVIDRENLRLEQWLNGVREHEILRLENYTRDQDASGSRLYLGNFFAMSDKAFNGYIDEFRVYRGTRNDTWIKLQTPIGRDLFWNYGQPEMLP